MQKVLFIWILVLSNVAVLPAQNRVVKFKDVEILQNEAEKPLVVLIMTSWCKYCHAMKNTMTKNMKVATLLNEKFYVVFLDAEEKEDIVFAGRSFKYRAGLNELARELGTIDGQLSYPTLTILNAKNEIIYQHNGFLSPSTLFYRLKKISSN